MYHLLQAKVMKKLGNYSEALKTLDICMNMANKGSKDVEFTAGFERMSTPDWTTVRLERVDCFLLTGQVAKASEAMEEAMEALKGTGEEVRLTVASADLSVGRGDVQQALATLRAVSNDHPYYMTARHKMADIYLTKLNDKRMYAATYREVAEKNPTTQSYLILGDAYMSIQEPERAIDVYELAVKRSPRDSDLTCRMGRALVKTHQYSRAINYYKDAIKTGGDNQLR